MRKFTTILMAMLVLVTCQLVIQAQSTTGSISGTVTDQTGAVVPGANVIIKGESGQQYTAVIKDDGVFTIPGVPAGTPTYTVTITAPSFKTAVIQNVKVDVATPATVNAQLEPGNINETVVVASGAEVLQTETATVGATIRGFALVHFLIVELTLIILLVLGCCTLVVPKIRMVLDEWHKLRSSSNSHASLAPTKDEEGSSISVLGPNPAVQPPTTAYSASTSNGSERKKGKKTRVFKRRRGKKSGLLKIS